MNFGTRSTICAQKKKTVSNPCSAPVVPASAEAGSGQHASDSLRTKGPTMISTIACHQMRPKTFCLIRKAFFSLHPKNLTLTPPSRVSSKSTRMSHQTSNQSTRTSPRYRMSSSSSLARWHRLTPFQRSKRSRSPTESNARKPKVHCAKTTSFRARSYWRRNSNSSNWTNSESTCSHPTSASR